MSTDWESHIVELLLNLGILLLAKNVKGWGLGKGIFQVIGQGSGLSFIISLSFYKNHKNPSPVAYASA
jgi:hypothetical protein